MEVVKQDLLGYSHVFMGHLSLQETLERIVSNILFIFLAADLIHATNTSPSSLSLQFKRQNKDYEKTKARIMEIANYVDKVRLMRSLLHTATPPIANSYIQQANTYCCILMTTITNLH